MEFQNFASKETASFIAGLLGTQSRATIEQLDALRRALDQAVISLSAPAPPDQPVNDLVTRLAGAANAEVQRIRLDAEAAAERLRAEVKAAQDRAEAAEHDLMITVDAHTEVEAHLRKLETDLKQTADARTLIETELAQAHATIEQLLADVEELRGRIEKQSAENATLAGRVAKAAEVERHRDTLVAELDASAKQVQRLEADLAHAQQLREQLDAAVEAGKARVQSLQQDAAKAREVRDQRDAFAAQLSASSTRIRALETDLVTANEVRDHRDALATQLDASNTRIRTLENDLLRANEVREQRDRLTAQLDAGNARMRTLEGEVAAANEVRGQRDALAARLDASGTRIRILETDLAKAKQVREHRDALATQLDEATARIRTLESELAAAQESDELRDTQSADAASERLRSLEKEAAAARALREERDRFAIQLEQSHARLQVLETEAADARETREEREQFAIQLEKRRTQVRVLEGEVDELRAALATRAERAAGPSVPAAAGDVQSLRGELDRMASLFDASARAVTEMAASNSSTELLAELVKRMSLHFSRVALFRLKGNRLEGEHQMGLDAGGDLTKLIIPTSVDSMLTRAVAAGAVETLHGKDVAERSGTPFGGTPSLAVALPVILQGTTLAVVYADDSGMSNAERDHTSREISLGFARLLVGQVVVLLVRHTHELKTLAELSQYATTLLQEAKEMYLADTQAGKNPDLIRKRLKDNIDCATQLYSYRATMEGATAAALLDQQMLAEMQEATAFARDLSSVLAEMADGDLHITAEAS